MNMRYLVNEPVNAVRPSWRGVALCAMVGGLLLTAGCSTRRLSQPAPVEDRSSTTRPADVRPVAGAENAGKPGFYTVRPGDTLYRIALEAGQSPRDLQAWNNLANPNLIEVGQVLRVTPPVANSAGMPPATTGVATAPVVAPGVVARPLNTPATTTPAPATGAPAVTATPVPAPAPTPEPASAGADDIAFVWPAQGSVIAPFDEGKNKGVAISGKVGDPVLAAADGRVVYAGAGLRGYGNLVILKHNNTYLTAYAHNQALLVREDQTVKQGQRIAEMGSSDADRVKLHFEVRRNGKPVDPIGYLPKR
ncbi:peptidoglycan DD-metalloendopeptidase family protein [Hydrogenophaga sp. RWCD_12]|uniref:peptidoglycan DD-metalloendopeptidase family protein n=1 Tax=Hydrogenophaga sp. RWCD_12 TaxID=3391190 RepID=UPI0039855992